MTREEYIEKINSLILQQDKEYLQTIDKLRGYYLAARKFVLENDLSLIKLTNPAKFYEILLYISKAFVLFPDKKINFKLKKWGVTQGITRWYVPLKKIEEKLNVISNRNILITKNLAIVNIVQFLQTKISAEILKQLKTILKLNDYPDIVFKKATNNNLRNSQERSEIR